MSRLWLRARRFARDMRRGMEFYAGVQKIEIRMTAGELSAPEALKEIEALGDRCRSRAL